MDFKFERLDRDPAENSERAFIAASRRKDRDFDQRMESLQKASDLHFERTGRRLEITPMQVAKPGPLMELSKGESKRQREAQRFQPYSHGKKRLGAAATRKEKTLGGKSSQQFAFPANRLTPARLPTTHTQSEAGEHEGNLVDLEGYPFKNTALELNPAVYPGDGLQNYDSAKLVTSQPEGYVDNKYIELSLKSKADIPSFLFEPTGWDNLCHDAFYASGELTGTELFDLRPSHQVDPEPEPSENPD